MVLEERIVSTLWALDKLKKNMQNKHNVHFIRQLLWMDKSLQNFSGISQPHFYGSGAQLVQIGLDFKLPGGSNPLHTPLTILEPAGYIHVHLITKMETKEEKTNCQVYFKSLYHIY